MARRRISEHFEIDFDRHSPVWREVRNSPGVDEYLERVGAETVARCDADLAAAQAKRKQPVEEGYDFHIMHGSRSRLTVFPATPRAMAHEAVNQAILKNLPMGAPPGHVAAPDREVPRELARRSNEVQGNTVRDEGDEL